MQEELNAAKEAGASQKAHLEATLGRVSILDSKLSDADAAKAVLQEEVASLHNRFAS